MCLRAINMLPAFNKFGWNVKFAITGAAPRQHKRDFLGGDTLSILDNHNLAANGADGPRADLSGPVNPAKGLRRAFDEAFLDWFDGPCARN